MGSSSSGVSRPPFVSPDLLLLKSDSILASLVLSDLVCISPQAVAPAIVLDCDSLPGLFMAPVISSVALSPWISKFKSSFHNLSKVVSPSFSEDVPPTVKSPDSITLGSPQIWKYHLMAYFHGVPLSPAKIFSDLNPIWGQQGRISVKHQSARICLIYIPCAVTRQWALDVGFWNSGNFSFTVSPWSPSADLSPMKLVHAPIWVMFKKVPPELWSLVGFSTIVSGVGIPVHSEFPKLNPYSNGVVKLNVVVELEKKRPGSVIVTNKIENFVLVSVEYPKLPPRCGSCKEFGHLDLRCPNPVARVNRPAPAVGGTEASVPSVVLPKNPVQSLARSKSLPSINVDDSEVSSSGGWLCFVHRSKPHLMSSSGTSSHSINLVTTSQFAEEKELINSAQAIMRQRITASEVHAPSFFLPLLGRK